MVSLQRIFATSVMAAIIVLGLTHVGVAIGIIIPARSYGAIFRPQIGLCSFDLVIALLALITGTMGLVMLIMENDRLCKVIAIFAAVLAVFSLASLTTALIINAKSLNYVGGRFRDYMNAYDSSLYARNIVDKIQKEGICCGENIWIDWSSVNLDNNETISTTTSSTSTVMTTTSTTASTTVSTSSSTTVSTTVSTSASTTATSTSMQVTTGPSGTTTIASSTSPSTTSMTPSPASRKVQKLDVSVRETNQQQRTYGDISGLPTTFNIVLPGSCCDSEATFTDNTTNLYCESSVDGVVNHFRTMGCAKGLDFTAGNQTMGIGVINSFLAALALVAIGILMSPPMS